MVHPNSDEIRWADEVSASYWTQKGEGVERPILSPHRESLALGLGGVRLQYLSEQGLQLQKEGDGPTYIVPIHGEHKVDQNG